MKTFLSIRSLLMLPVVALLFYGCDDILTNQHPYGDDFVLQHGQRALVGGETLVRFIGIAEDSRCPSDVECVWEGNARADLEMRVSGYDPVRFSLNTHTGFTNDTVINGVRIQLLDVMPYPKSTVSIDPKAYSVRLVVTK